MNARNKGFLAAALVAGGVLSAMLINSGSAWADPSYGWRMPANYNHYNHYAPRYMSNNNGFFGRFFGHGNNYYRPQNRWAVAHANWGRSRFQRGRFW